MSLDIAVFGLGRFGKALCEELVKRNYTVLAVDIDPVKVKALEGIATRTALQRTLDETGLRDTLVGQCEVAVVGFAKNIEANILITQMLHEMGIPYVIARAENDVHSRILERLGADDIFSPEEDMATRLAGRITGSGFMDYIEISDEYCISEFQTPEDFVGKKISELDLRGKFGIQILAIRRDKEVIIPPDPYDPLQQEDYLICLGKRESVNELSKAHK
ncbi:MAG TPA: TrkA family potassium uptake protein [Caldisericia bacterium]|nr:TrkA family potassium uptake protein [Caldisericia bacterium]HPF49380.1 TrkA family potassium uptake protein [Caldisericia bacterium]HPI84456.1 TrkA family potassium uptake protein [Caldisericia bacterium]HPQ93783.1 TrkA family potassium uptake protein [Caldisericia bacterium]HRV75653.1 TrkA family potassium uptake protein [Caldisericia bacterium]